MEYTINYHLPQWAESDRIMMGDFNQMCSSIDQGLTTAQSSADKAYSPEKKPYAVGSYTGNHGIKTINLGFHPSFLIITGDESSNTSSGHYATLGCICCCSLLPARPPGSTGSRERSWFDLTEVPCCSFPCAVKSVSLVCDSLIIGETDRRVQVFLTGGPEFLVHQPNEFIGYVRAAVPVMPGDLIDRAADCHRRFVWFGFLFGSSIVFVTMEVAGSLHNIPPFLSGGAYASSLSSKS